MIQVVKVQTQRQGLYDVTAKIAKVVAHASVTEGLATLYLQHTSASLLIQENYDPSARNDLQTWLNRLVPENDSLYTHTIEGPDDMPAHIKAMLTAVSVSIPIMDNCLALGTWQGIFLWEHRHGAQGRSIIVHVGG